VLGGGDLVVTVRKLPEHPAGEQLVDAPVEDHSGKGGVEIPAELARLLAALDDAADRLDRLHEVADPLLDLGAARDLTDEHANDVRLVPPGAQQDRRHMTKLVARRLARPHDRVDPFDEHSPVLAEDRLEHLVLGREVVVEQAVCDAGLLGDVTDTRRVEALVCEDAHGRIEDQTTLLFGTRCALAQGRRRVVVGSPQMQALGGTLVVDLTRYLPGAFASRELQRLGARVVRVEAPGGDPMRHTAAEWHDALNAGKESVVCDLPADATFAQALLARADVVLESFRPGVAARLGVGPDDAREDCVYCSITGFGVGGPHEQRAGHDLNYLGWAGLLHATAPALPPVQAADLAAGALGAVTEVLAALLYRERGAGGARIVVSMTHGSQRLAPGTPVLTGGFACYSIYDCKDGRRLTVAALEPKFFVRLCELIGRPELADRQYAEAQDELERALAGVFVQQPLEHWLRLFSGDDVCVGPVATPAEGAAEFGVRDSRRAPGLGEHTADWRRELQR
jgi:alpha-methylacyl-CoA racemase